MTATFIPTISLPTVPIKQAKLYINGQWRAASDGKTRPTLALLVKLRSQTFPKLPNKTWKMQFGSSPRMTDLGKDVWARRQQILTRVSELIEQYADDLALCETPGQGNPLC